MGGMTRVTEFESQYGQELFLIVQTGSGAHPNSYPMGTVGFFTEVRRQGREAEH
jgi:hypothetical protein